MADIIKYWTTQVAAIEAALRAFAVFVGRGFPTEAKEAVRLQLGTWLVVALEFELAVDILRTAIAPTWNEVGLLATIIGLRTILNYILQVEIEKAHVLASNLAQMNATDGTGVPSAPTVPSLGWLASRRVRTSDLQHERRMRHGYDGTQRAGHSLNARNS
jgi:uncharacterized membrane protein